MSSTNLDNDNTKSSARRMHDLGPPVLGRIALLAIVAFAVPSLSC